MPNRLDYGDHLDVPRNEIASESVDLDPPFDGQATYNVPFRSPNGDGPDAPIDGSRTPATGTTPPRPSSTRR